MVISSISRPHTFVSTPMVVIFLSQKHCFFGTRLWIILCSVFLERCRIKINHFQHLAVATQSHPSKADCGIQMPCHAPLIQSRPENWPGQRNDCEKNGNRWRGKTNRPWKQNHETWDTRHLSCWVNKKNRLNIICWQQLNVKPSRYYQTNLQERYAVQERYNHVLF